MPPKKKPAAARGYQFAEPLPKNTILEDLAKKRWRLGPSIGRGGFGEIYSAQEENAKGSNYPYVVKIEPHANGPLFVEINFYVRFAKPELIDAFKKEKGLNTFGMPVYYGSGSHEHKDEKYRFLVIDKFSSDINELLKKNNKIFPSDTVFKIGIQLLDVLEYIHQCGYVHADIKPANILLGASKETQKKQVYLVDFGLAVRYTLTKEFKPNPKRAHDGTIEYLSRDAHKGVPTRRGDLEILVYNLIQWLGCKLPWEDNTADPKVVENSKESNMATPSKMIKACFGTKPHPKAIVDLLTYLQTLKFDSEPNYNTIRKILVSGVKEAGGSIGTILKFSIEKTPSTKKTPSSVKSSSTKVKANKGDSGEPSGAETPKLEKRGRLKRNIGKVEESNGRKQTNNSANEEKMEFVTLRKRKPASFKDNENGSADENDEDSSADEKDEDDPVPEKRGRKQTPKIDNDAKQPSVQKNKNNSNSKLRKRRKSIKENDDTTDIDSIPKPPTNRRIRNVVKNLTPDIDSSKKRQRANPKLKKKRSMSLNDVSNSLVDPFKGYTAAMREVMMKKLEKDSKKGKKATVNVDKAGSGSDIREDNEEGFTDEMKEIAAKKQTKPKRRQGRTPSVSSASSAGSASTSRATVSRRAAKS